MNKYTVIAYIDGDYGVTVHVLKVEAKNPGEAWDAAEQKAAEEIGGTISEQGVRVSEHEIANLTHVCTFAGWCEEV